MKMREGSDARRKKEKKKKRNGDRRRELSGERNKHKNQDYLFQMEVRTRN